jgi:hypothetical protein
VDNSRNTSDVFAKLVRLGGSSRAVARVFLVTGGGQFTLTDLTAGSYELRYRDLTSGALNRSAQLDFEETPGAEGIQFTALRVTLDKTLPLAESGFEEDHHLSP